MKAIGFAFVCFACGHTTPAVVHEELVRAASDFHASVTVGIVLDAATGKVLAAEGGDAKRVTGSTLKPITVAAALDAKTIAVDARLDCATRAYGSENLHDASEHGVLSLEDTIVFSSNVGASRVYDTLGMDRFVGTMRRFHFTDLPPITDPTSIQAAVFAAGELYATPPMELALAYATIFNDGVFPGTAERVISPDTASVIISMLRNVVARDDGTGTLARINGVVVAGKTGTADVPGGRYASFVGTILDRTPRLVILVGIVSDRENVTGKSAAAPLFARIAKRLL